MNRPSGRDVPAMVRQPSGRSTTGYPEAQTATGSDVADPAQAGRLTSTPIDATPGVAIPIAETPGVAHSPYWEPWHDWTFEQYAGVRFGTVYRCYDTGGRLIYVGSTGDIWNRISAHRVQTAFYDRFARITYRDKPMAEARALEVAIIQAECPPLNKQHNPTYDALPAPERKALFAAELAAIPVSPAEPVVENEIPVAYFAERMRAAERAA